MVGYSLWRPKESDATEATVHAHIPPLCLEDNVPSCVHNLETFSRMQP